jgi:hypothetical protein
MKAHFYSIPLTLLFCSLLSYSETNAQELAEREEPAAVELGIMAGGSLYYGDLAASKRNYFSEFRPHIGVMAQRFIGRNVSLRGNFYVGNLEGNDAWYDDPEWRKHRNFSFKSVQIEGSFIATFDVLRSIRLERGRGFGAYLFTGLGLCYTNPQRNFNDVDEAYFSADDPAVKDYYADMSRDPNHLSLVIPVGVGVRHSLGKRTSVFIEGSVRQCLDDRLDGYSSSVFSRKFDAYSFVSLGALWRLKHKDR